jgi:hypothetical protein
MLPNTPGDCRAVFGTLVALYPNRIFKTWVWAARSGIGLAGIACALRRDHQNHADSFPQDVQEPRSLSLPRPARVTRVVPGAGLQVPRVIAGSSL